MISQFEIVFATTPQQKTKNKNGGFLGRIWFLWCVVWWVKIKISKKKKKSKKAQVDSESCFLIDSQKESHFEAWYQEHVTQNQWQELSQQLTRCCHFDTPPLFRCKTTAIVNCLFGCYCCLVFFCCLRSVNGLVFSVCLSQQQINQNKTKQNKRREEHQSVVVAIFFFLFFFLVWHFFVACFFNYHFLLFRIYSDCPIRWGRRVDRKREFRILVDLKQFPDWHFHWQLQKPSLNPPNRSEPSAPIASRIQWNSNVHICSFSFFVCLFVLVVFVGFALWLIIGLVFLLCLFVHLQQIGLLGFHLVEEGVVQF